MAARAIWFGEGLAECKIVNGDKVCEYALYDERIGKSHLAVPGPDGDRGADTWLMS